MALNAFRILIEGRQIYIIDHECAQMVECAYTKYVCILHTKCLQVHVWN